MNLQPLLAALSCFVIISVISVSATAQQGMELKKPSSKNDILFGGRLPAPADDKDQDNALPDAAPGINRNYRHGIQPSDLETIRRNLNEYKRQAMNRGKDGHQSRSMQLPVSTQSKAGCSNNFQLVKDINSLAESYAHNYGGDRIDINNNFFGNDSLPFAVLNDVAYFVADDGIHGSELWRSDGTAGGTSLLKDIEAGIASSNIYICSF